MLPYGSEFSNQTGEFPLQYRASEFALTYNGKFPYTTLIKKRLLIKDTMRRCTICGYEYDEASEGTPFDHQLPEDWKCPVCNAPKEAFERIK